MLSSDLWQAQFFYKAKCDADKLQKAHLEALLNQALAANQQKKSKALKYLIQAKWNQQFYARFWNHTKLKSAGRLAFVTVTTKDGNKKPSSCERQAEGYSPTI